ncbi:hypothetical protein [Lactiplantibacillus plantarum]|uniref:hypothetical protein n=1 Tax=Lactiplantibacillus plantarum TaxID=1590 RepID=UPI003C222A6D
MLYSEISQALKDLAAAAKRAQDLEVNNKIIDVQEMIMELMEENRNLQQQLNNTKKIEERRRKLKKIGNYWAKDEATYKKFKEETYPYSDEVLANIYCATCLWKDNNFISVNNHSKLYGGQLICPVCRSFNSVHSV